MLIYEIIYSGKKSPNIFSDILAFINSNQDDYLFLKTTQRTQDKIYVLFQKEYYNYFSSLFEAYHFKKLNRLPKYETFTPLIGNPELLKKSEMIYQK